MALNVISQKVYKYFHPCCLPREFTQPENKIRLPCQTGCLQIMSNAQWGDGCKQLSAQILLCLVMMMQIDSVLIVDSWSRTCSTKNNKLKPSPLIWAYKHPSLIWGRKTFPNSSRSLITSWNSSQGVKSAARVICEQQLLHQFKLSDDYCPKSPLQHTRPPYI